MEAVGAAEAIRGWLLERSERIEASPASGRTVTGLLGDARVRFLLAGGLNTAFGYACFVAYHATVGVRWGYMWALLLAHATSMLFAFLIHRRYTFRVRGSVLRDLWRFESVTLSALGINGMLLPFSVELLHLQVLVAQAMIVGVTATYSWFGHSRYSFGRRGSLDA